MLCYAYLKYTCYAYLKYACIVSLIYDSLRMTGWFSLHLGNNATLKYYKIVYYYKLTAL